MKFIERLKRTPKAETSERSQTSQNPALPRSSPEMIASTSASSPPNMLRSGSSPQGTPPPNNPQSAINSHEAAHTQDAQRYASNAQGSDNPALQPVSQHAPASKGSTHGLATLPRSAHQASASPRHVGHTTPPRDPATGFVAHIRSFVNRRGHITQAQKEALDVLVPKWSIPYQDTQTDFTRWFGREAPLILEIGFGMGETTAQIAHDRPHDNFLGVEVFGAGVGALAKRIEAMGLTNIRVIQHDAVEVVRDMLAPDSLAGVHIYFPDPWPKKRHHKRRLIQPPFVSLLASRIAPGGYLHCATDWQHYAEQMLEVLNNEPLLENTAGAKFAERPGWRPQTKFETRGLRLGHGVWDVLYRRKPDSLLY